VTGRPARALPTTADVRAYWDRRIHDLEVSRHPAGTPGFFADLDEYHFDKLHHLLRLVDYGGYAGRRVLDVGCGAGVDLARFAGAGARAVGVDVSESAVALARRNLAQRRLDGLLCPADAEALPFPDETFDFVFAHGVVQYACGDQAVVDECRRVVKRGGTVFIQVYNRVSWLNALSRLMKVGLEHEDAPVLRKYSPGEFRRLLRGFAHVRVLPERFPVRSRLHRGWKGALYNGLFVGVFNALPRRLVRRFGWHLLAFCRK